MAKYLKILLILSLSLYFVSLTQDGFAINNDYVKGDSPGFLYVLIGGFGLIFGGAGLSWLANPFIMLSWFFSFFKKDIISLAFSVLAVIASCSFLLFDEIIKDEAGNYGQITDYLLGYWLWIGSCILMLVRNLLLFIGSSQSKIIENK